MVRRKRSESAERVDFEENGYRGGGKSGCRWRARLVGGFAVREAGGFVGTVSIYGDPAGTDVVSYGARRELFVTGSTLRDEIKQTKPFGSAKEELWLNLLRTSALASHGVEQRLRPHGLSPTQYNVLRILRGAGGRGLCQYEIGERLVAQVPDVPRIVERMEKAGWVQRVRGEEDRRMVMASLTSAGLALVDSLDGVMEEMAGGVFEGLSVEQMQQLNELLVLARK
jgi:DNA-binding MarR family transcriptional regulator